MYGDHPHIVYPHYGDKPEAGVLGALFVYPLIRACYGDLFRERISNDIITKHYGIQGPQGGSVQPLGCDPLVTGNAAPGAPSFLCSSLRSLPVTESCHILCGDYPHGHIGIIART